MSNYTTEITSDKIRSDNPIHQRLLKAYIIAKDLVQGDLLEIGCGEGRGIEELSGVCQRYVALDKITETVHHLQEKYDTVEFINATIPPVPLPDEGFDTIVSFQVIEHIKNDLLYLQEIHRLLRPGGKAFITTPNIKMTLSRNPWHIREYTAESLEELSKKVFRRVEVKGIAGDEKVMEYHDRNRASVNKIMRFDIFNLQHKLPAGILKIPYEILNRRNRNSLNNADNQLVSSISTDNYLYQSRDEKNLDLFCILTKD